MTGTLRVRVERVIVDLMTFLGEPPQTEPRGGGNKKEKKSILDNQGKIETTIL